MIKQLANEVAVQVEKELPGRRTQYELREKYSQLMLEELHSLLGFVPNSGTILVEFLNGVVELSFGSINGVLGSIIEKGLPTRFPLNRQVHVTENASEDVLRAKAAQHEKMSLGNFKKERSYKILADMKSPDVEVRREAIQEHIKDLLAEKEALEKV